MNPERLLQNFDRLIDTPDAVPRLRRFILDLAVRGKLVEQNPEDEPAVEFLKRIEVEKKQRFSSSDKKTQPLYEDQIPFTIPDNWQWTQLAQVGVINPRNDAEDSTDASFVPMPLIFAEYGRSNQHEVRPWSEIKKGFTHFADGDVGVAKITPCFENRKSTVFRNLTGGFGAGTTELHIIRPVLVLPDYILLYLKTPYFIETGIQKMTGTAGQKRVPKDYFSFSPFPLPPLAEQHRIVAKVDELMKLCDVLEAAQAKREKRRDRLVAATLHGLNNSDSDSDASEQLPFKDSARFYFNHLPRLTTRPEHIQQLRHTILNLAVRGKLVPQDPKDEPASEVLRRIEAEKERLFCEGEIKNQELLEPVDEGDMPFGIAYGWQVVRMGRLARKLGAGSTPLGGKTVYQNEGVPFLRSQNVHDDNLRLDDVALIPRTIHNQMSGTHIQNDDILLNITGASIGRCALVPKGFSEGNVSQHVAIIRLFDPSIREFIHLSLISPIYQKMIMDVQVGVSREGLSMQRLKMFPMVLPPLAEQHRIVEKVDELMALCNEMESRIATNTTTSQNFLEATLQETLNGKSSLEQGVIP